MEGDMYTTRPSPDAATGHDASPESDTETAPVARSPSAAAATASQSPNGGESPVDVPGFTPVNPPQPASPEALPVTEGLAELEADPRRTHRTWKPHYSRVTKCDSCNGRSPGVVQECDDKRCTIRFCEGCARGNLWHSQHRTHFIDADKCNWEVKKLPPKPRATPRARQAQRSGGSGSKPSSRKRRMSSADLGSDEDVENRRPAKRTQPQPLEPRPILRPISQLGAHYQPPTTGRTPLPSMHISRSITRPSPLRYSQTYTHGPTSQTNWPVAETVELANAAVRGLERQHTEGYAARAPRGGSEFQRHREIESARPDVYTSGPHRGYQPGRILAPVFPLPSINRPHDMSGRGTSYRPMDGPSEEAAQPPVESRPSPLSSADRRQVKSLYRIITETDYQGNFETYFRRPIPHQSVPVWPHPPASLGSPAPNPYDRQHQKTVANASQLLPPPPTQPSGYAEHSFRRHPSHDAIHNDARILDLVRRAWSTDNDVRTLRRFQGDSAILTLFWDVFNLYCSQNSIHDAPNTTNWFVDKKRDMDFEQERARRRELQKERDSEREAHKQRMQPYGVRNRDFGNPPY